jgi:hypothetical protein
MGVTHGGLTLSALSVFAFSQQLVRVRLLMRNGLPIVSALPPKAYLKCLQIPVYDRWSIFYGMTSKFPILFLDRIRSL